MLRNSVSISSLSTSNVESEENEEKGESLYSVHKNKEGTEDKANALDCTVHDPSDNEDEMSR